MTTVTKPKLADIPLSAPITWQNGQAYLEYEGKQWKISAQTAATRLGIEIPDFSQLEHWVFDGLCESVLGYQVEPDGIDEEGSPSWLLAFGIM